MAKQICFYDFVDFKGTRQLENSTNKWDGPQNIMNRQ